MDRERRRTIEELFDRALDLEPPARDAFLIAACGDDEALLREVRALLDAHQRREGLLDRASGPPVPESLLQPSLHDRRIGPYRIVDTIGRGGMAVVYRAERDDGAYRQTVAIKVIRAGSDPEELERRFQAERQILATLEHPDIARLLDGGITGDGRPYLVMEYVPGLPIHRYCDRLRLTVDERLRLFCAVGRAVQHAHRKLVVHRDLKPSNILVTADGRVKLLDFGIAKILDPGTVGRDAPPTRTGLRLMTPEYASPEQILGQAVTTANDVYALGVILYELLTGRRPFRMEGKPVGERERLVLEEEPPRASTVVFRSVRPGGGDLPSTPTPELVGRDRRTSLKRLQKRLRGDLDRILSMALRKEPERRYASAEQLVEDLERHLEGRPVLATGDSVGYRVRKFVARNRWWVGTAALLALSLAGGIVGTAIQAQRARQEAAEAAVQRDVAAAEAEKASRVTALLVDLFHLSDPSRTLGDTITAREVLARGTLRIEEELSDQPLTQADLLAEVAEIHANLGLLDRAEELAGRALELRRLHGGADGLALGRSLAQMASVLSARGRKDDALDAYRRAEAIFANRLDPSDTVLARVRSDLAWELRDQGDSEQAARLFEAALDVQEGALGDDRPELGRTLLGLAAAYHDAGAFDEARALFQSALRRRDTGRPSPTVATALLNVGMLDRLRERYLEAEPVLRSALDMRTALYGGTHPDVLAAVREWGTVLMALGRYGEALPVVERALEVSVADLGPEHQTTSDLGETLAAGLTIVGRFDEALVRYDSTLAWKRRRLGPDHPGVAFTMVRSADPLLGSGEHGGATERLRRTLALVGQDGESVYGLLARNGLARVALERGRIDEADRLLAEAREIGERTLRPDHRYVLALDRTRARLLLARGDPRGALALADAVLEAESAVRPEPHPRRAETLVLAARAHEALGDTANARSSWFAARRNLAEVDESHPDLREVRRALDALDGSG